MNRFTKMVAGAGIVGSMIAMAAPASAQSYDPYYRGDTVGRVVDAIGRVSGAVVNATRGGGYYNPGYGYQYGNAYGGGFERHAVNACNYEAERRYYRQGRPDLRVQNVQWVQRDRAMVTGTVEVRDGRYGYGYGNYGRVLSFECEVRSDGRVVDFDDREFDPRYRSGYRW
jgi:hypothetical protein